MPVEGVFESERNRTLHVLVVTGGTPPAFDLLHAVGVTDREPSLAALCADGFVDRRPHATIVTQPGRDAHCDLLAAWREQADVAQLQRVYDSFCGSLNTEFKSLVTEWQTGRATGGADLYWDVYTRLQTVHDRVAPILRRAEGTDARFGGYRPLLRGALQRLEAGEQDYLTGMKVASYHSVWWWLHEDLLRSLDLKEENR